MSWVQLNGITWPMTRQIAEVKLHHWREDAQCPRQQWSLELSHCVSVPERDAADEADQKLLLLRLETLGFSTHDWRRLEGYEFRADAAWPKPVWGVVPARPYEREELNSFGQPLRKKIWLD